MTITDNGRRSTDQLLAQARELVEDGRLPSKNAMQKALRVAWPTINDVYATVARELEDAKARKRRQARTAIRALSSRKKSRRAPIIVHAPLQASSEPVAVEPPESVVEPVVEAAPVVVEENPAEPVVASSVRRPVVTWPAWLVASPAFVAIWAGWVGIGKLTGFGKVNLLPGFGGGWVIDTAITLPVGVEAYAGYAFYVALHRAAPRRARKFAAWSALTAVLLGMGGQTAYHLMAADGLREAPWWITTIVSCLPVAVWGLAAALVHMVRAGEKE